MPSSQNGGSVSSPPSVSLVQLEPDLINLEDDVGSAHGLGSSSSRVPLELDPAGASGLPCNGQVVNLTGTEFKRSAVGRTGASSKRGGSGSSKNHSLATVQVKHKERKDEQNPFGSLEDLGSHSIVPPSWDGSPTHSETLDLRTKNKSEETCKVLGFAENVTYVLRSGDKTSEVKEGGLDGKGHDAGEVKIKEEVDMNEHIHRNTRESSESDEEGNIKDEPFNSSG